MKQYYVPQGYLLGYPSLAKRDAAIVRYIVSHEATIRQAAKKFGIGKSTVHVICQKFMARNPKSVTTKKLLALFEYHLNIRHLNGGEATKAKFAKEKCK